MTELVWAGKYDQDGRRAAPLRLALPFQTVETINESTQDRQKSLALFDSGGDVDWRNRLIWGDKKYVLPALREEVGGSVDLIYIDPPFATGADFSFDVKVGAEDFTKEPSVLEQKAYRDTWGRGIDSYLQWMYETAVLLHDLLSRTGSLYVHLDATVVHYVKGVLDEVFGPGSFQREIVWRIGWISGYKSAAKNWIRNHDTILFYVRTPGEFTFNKEYVPYPEGYHRRGEEGIPESGKGYPIEDVWNANPFEFALKADESLDSIQIKSFSQEKTGYPTQKNESLVRRIIKASSNPGDLVLDCFVGSGTTAIASERLDRRWIVADLGRFAIHTTRKRLLSVPGIRPFVVQNLGKYERQVWQAAEFGDEAEPRTSAYRRFILALYKARPIEGYTWLHGVKQGRLVHVGTVDSPVTVGDVKQIAVEFQRTIGTGDDAPTSKSVDVLGWDFAFEMNEMARETASRAGLDIHFWRIPREVLEKRAVEQGDLRFFELAALGLDLSRDGRKLELRIGEFMIPTDDVPDDIQRAITDWTQWIDYWAVDWDNKDDTFHNEWQTYRTRKNAKLQLSATHEYQGAGTYRVVVKVIDILGNDTTKSIAVEVL